MARFLVCMLVVELKVARWDRCLMRYSRVLDFDKRLYLVCVNLIYNHFKIILFVYHCYPPNYQQGE